MIKMSTVVVAIIVLSGTAASAQPSALNDAQLDRVSAGGLSLSVLTGAAPSSVTLPPPLSALLTVPQAASVAINVNATVPPAVISVSHPDH